MSPIPRSPGRSEAFPSSGSTTGMRLIGNIVAFSISLLIFYLVVEIVKFALMPVIKAGHRWLYQYQPTDMAKLLVKRQINTGNEIIPEKTASTNAKKSPWRNEPFSSGMPAIVEEYDYAATHETRRV